MDNVENSKFNPTEVICRIRELLAYDNLNNFDLLTDINDLSLKDNGRVRMIAAYGPGAGKTSQARRLVYEMRRTQQTALFVSQTNENCDELAYDIFCELVMYEYNLLKDPLSITRELDENNVSLFLTTKIRTLQILYWDNVAVFTSESDDYESVKDDFLYLSKFPFIVTNYYWYLARVPIISLTSVEYYRNTQKIGGKGRSYTGGNNYDSEYRNYIIIDEKPHMILSFCALFIRGKSDEVEKLCSLVRIHDPQSIYTQVSNLVSEIDDGVFEDLTVIPIEVNQSSGMKNVGAMEYLRSTLKHGTDNLRTSTYRTLFIVAVTRLIEDAIDRGLSPISITRKYLESVDFSSFIPSISINDFTTQKIVILDGTGHINGHSTKFDIKVRGWSPPKINRLSVLPSLPQTSTLSKAKMYELNDTLKQIASSITSLCREGPTLVVGRMRKAYESSADDLEDFSDRTFGESVDNVMAHIESMIDPDVKHNYFSTHYQSGKTRTTSEFKECENIVFVYPFILPSRVVGTRKEVLGQSDTNIINCYCEEFIQALYRTVLRTDGTLKTLMITRDIFELKSENNRFITTVSKILGTDLTDVLDKATYDEKVEHLRYLLLGAKVDKRLITTILDMTRKYGKLLGINVMMTRDELLEIKRQVFDSKQSRFANFLRAMESINRPIVILE